MGKQSTNVHSGTSGADREARQAGMTWQGFQQLAREHMQRYIGVRLTERNLPGVPKRFDMVSDDASAVGDAKYLSLVRGHAMPPAKFMEIAGHVWLLEKTGAQRLFLVFGNQREVPQWWLKKYRPIAGRVEFYFMSCDGNIERLH
jgi:hypothetical protein